MRTVVGLKFLKLEKRSLGLKKKMADKWCPKGYTMSELRSEFPAGFTRAMTGDEENAKLSRARVVAPGRVVLGRDLVHKHPVGPKEMAAMPEINLPSKVVAEEMIKMKKKGVPYNELRMRCMESDLVRSHTHFRRVMKGMTERVSTCMFTFINR